MKRFHVHVSVDELATSLRFYSALFGAAPTVSKPDYAKWMLDDPRVNFAISHRARTAGVNHLGIQVEEESELAAIRARLVEANGELVEESGATCCYARSDKYWVTDPQGVAWETFRTLGSAPVYGEDTPAANAEACCVPLKQATAAEPCCVPGSVKSASSCCAGSAK